MATASHITNGRFYGTGRRKTSVARVYLAPGNGNVVINGKSSDDYFLRETTRLRMMEPLTSIGQEGKMDISANVCGGGLTGQADAVRHGLSRALVEMDAELRGSLKKAGMLTRDSRAKERKKYGQPGARKRYQFSKR